MKKIWEWASGWYNTLVIKYRNPGLYEYLKNLPEFDQADYVEVPQPGEGRLLIHKDAVENLRKLGGDQQQ